MPYFISDQEADCAGWATVKENEGGELIVIHCHATKQEAIDQMVAISLKEGLEPGGERALPENYRPALAEDVPKGAPAGTVISTTSRTCKATRRGASAGTSTSTAPTTATLGAHEEDDDNEQEAEGHGSSAGRSDASRIYHGSSCSAGLEYHAAGLSGDGVVDRTIREARLLADGKCRKTR
jgi:hypothetical protein